MNFLELFPVDDRVTCLYHFSLPPDFGEKTQTKVVWAHHTIIWTDQDYPTGNSSRREMKRQTEEMMGRQHQRVVCLLVGCLTSQQQASVSQGRICSDNFTCCHTEIEVADPTFYLTQSQYTDTGLTSPSADPITPGAWQGSHWSANFQVTGMTRPRKKSRR